MKSSAVFASMLVTLTLTSCSLLFESDDTNGDSDASVATDDAMTGQPDARIAPLPDAGDCLSMVDCGGTCVLQCITTFDPNNGEPYSHTTAPGCKNLQIQAWGAGGGGGIKIEGGNPVSNSGAAAGGYIDTVYSVGEVQALIIYVGAPGANAGGVGDIRTGGMGGAPGGAAGGIGGQQGGTNRGGGGGGGGFSGVFRTFSGDLGQASDNAIAIAGGGGGSGGGNETQTRAGAGGGSAGQNGSRTGDNLTLGGGHDNNLLLPLAGGGVGHQVMTNGQTNGGGGGYQGGQGGDAAFSDAEGGAGGSGFVDTSRTLAADTTLETGDGSTPGGTGVTGRGNAGEPVMPGKVILTCRP